MTFARAIVLLFAAFMLSSPAHAQRAALNESYTIPSDSKATYSNLSIEGTGRYRKIATLRKGPSGDGYSLREYDCQQNRVRYLATGDTRAELKKIKPDPWGPIVAGSIAAYIGGQACASGAISTPARTLSSPIQQRSAPAVKRAAPDTGVSCPCSSGRVCVGPRGGRYCITSGGNKKYGV